jgi:hypothetical protein
MQCFLKKRSGMELLKFALILCMCVMNGMHGMEHKEKNLWRNTHKELVCTSNRSDSSSFVQRIKEWAPTSSSLVQNSKNAAKYLTYAALPMRSLAATAQSQFDEYTVQQFFSDPIVIGCLSVLGVCCCLGCCMAVCCKDTYRSEYTHVKRMPVPDLESRPTPTSLIVYGSETNTVTCTGTVEHKKKKNKSGEFDGLWLATVAVTSQHNQHVMPLASLTPPHYDATAQWTARMVAQQGRPHTPPITDDHDDHTLNSTYTDDYPTEHDDQKYSDDEHNDQENSSGHRDNNADDDTD